MSSNSLDSLSPGSNIPEAQETRCLDGPVQPTDRAAAPLEDRDKGAHIDLFTNCDLWLLRSTLYFAFLLSFGLCFSMMTTSGDKSQAKYFV